MTKDKAKMIFDLLGFQYKPLEKQLLQQVDAKTKANYLKKSYAERIIILDKVAAMMNL